MPITMYEVNEFYGIKGNNIDHRRWKQNFNIEFLASG